MGKTKHNKISLRVPTNCTTAKTRKEYQDNEKPKNKPGSLFFKYGVPGVTREDQVDGHKSGGKTKRVYSRILRKKLNQETNDIINDQDINEND
jgi:hypothetical protein